METLKDFHLKLNIGLCTSKHRNVFGQIINKTASHAPCPATQGHIPYALL